MEPSTNSDQMCYLCKDLCSSLADLKQHIKVVHNLKKSEADVFVKLSVEEKLRRKEEANLDEEEEKELSEEFKAFLEAEVKSSFDFLFKDLFDVLNGKVVPNIPEEELDEDFSVSDIRDAFQRLGDEIQNVEIRESLIDAFKQDFESQKLERENSKQEQNTNTKKDPNTDTEREPKRKQRDERQRFKIPERREAETGLLPITSDHSSRFFILDHLATVEIFLSSFPFSLSLPTDFLTSHIILHAILISPTRSGRFFILGHLATIEIYFQCF